jgi:hypothetical protein
MKIIQRKQAEFSRYTVLTGHTGNSSTGNIHSGYGKSVRKIYIFIQKNFSPGDLYIERLKEKETQLSLDSND